MDTSINAIVPHNPTGLIIPEPAPERTITPEIWHMLAEIGRSAFNAHMFKGVPNAETAAMVMLKGYELGLGISASFEFVQPVMGKFELIPRGALALMHNSPLIKSVEVTRLADGNKFIGYQCTIIRSSGFTYTTRFTLADAERAGLVKPDSGWAKYPENLCMWRAIGFAADVAAPDITAGMTTLLKMPEQYGVAIDGVGNVVELPDPAKVQQVRPALDLPALLEDYTAEEIMLANNGRIPTTDEELAAVAKTLGAAHD